MDTTWNSSMNVERWRKEFAFEAAKLDFLSKFAGPSENNAIQIVDDLKAKKGSTIHVDLIMKLLGSGVTGDNIMAGNEEDLVQYEQSVVVDQLRHGVKSKGKMDNKKVLTDFRKTALRQLKIWFNEKLDSDLITVLSASPTRTLGADNGGTPRIDSASKSNLAAVDVITIDDIRLMKTLATNPYTSTHPKIRPIKSNGENYYLLVIGSESAYDLKTNAAYNTLMRDAWWRGEKNPLFHDAKVVVDNVLVHEYEGISQFDDGGGAAIHGEVNLFMGAQAGIFARGGDHSWHEETVDRGNKLSVTGGLIYELAKTKFNSVDFATIAYYCETTDLSA